MKTVLITGGSRGIGKAIALKFAENNYNILLCYRKNTLAAEETKEEILRLGAKCFLYKADVSNENDVRNMFELIANSGFEVDVLINNAGVSLCKLINDTQTDEWNNVFAVNVTGTFLCSKYAISKMIQRKAGKIINISSMWGQVGASCEVAYSASKAAVIGFTKALAKELAPSQIMVNCIAPGVIDTQMNSHLSKEDIELLKEEIPLMKIGKGEDVANVAFFLSSDKADYITGQTIAVNGGIVI